MIQWLTTPRIEQLHILETDGRSLGRDLVRVGGTEAVLLCYQFLTALAAVDVLRSQLAVLPQDLAEAVEKQNVVGLALRPRLAIFVERPGCVGCVGKLEDEAAARL